MGGVNWFELDLFRYLEWLAIFTGEHRIRFVVTDEGFRFAIKLEMTSYHVFGLVQLDAIVLEVVLHAFQVLAGHLVLAKELVLFAERLLFAELEGDIR